MDPIEELKKLKSLLDQGAITEEEFQMLKKDVILKSSGKKKPAKKDTNQPILKEKPKKPQNKSVKGKNTKRKAKEPITNVTEWGLIFMGLGALAGFILGIVFGVRYDFSAALFIITIAIAIAIPVIIVYLLRFRFSQMVLFLIFAFYIFLIATPIGNISTTNTSNESSSSYSTSSSTSTHSCSYCGTKFSGYGYYHIFDECRVGDKNINGSMCSRKCCMESWNATH